MKKKKTAVIRAPNPLFSLTEGFGLCEGLLEILRHADCVYITPSPRRPELGAADGLQGGKRAVVDL